MKKIIVYFNAGSAPSIMEYLDFPPQNVIYQTRATPAQTKRYYGRVAYVKRSIVKNVTNVFRVPRMIYIRTNADLIHSARGMLILNHKPWVIDVEHPASFVSLEHHMLKDKIATSIIKNRLASNYCKKILPHSEASRKALEHVIDTRNFKDKIETVYLAERPYGKKIPRRRNEKITLLFTGKGFFTKGGKEVLQAYDILKKKYDAQLIMKSDVPQNFRRKFNDVNYIDGAFPRDVLFSKTYLKSDIFIFPSFIDSYGIVMIEAMSTELPVITTDIFAAPEIIENDKGGFVIESQLRWNDENGLLAWNSWDELLSKTKLNYPKNVAQIVDRTTTLIENTSLRKKMGKFNKERIDTGKLSIKERNKKLRRIYEEALRF